MVVRGGVPGDSCTISTIYIYIWLLDPKTSSLANIDPTYSCCVAGLCEPFFCGTLKCWILFGTVDSESGHQKGPQRHANAYALEPLGFKPTPTSSLRQKWVRAWG